MRTPILILGIVLLLGGIGLAIYGINVPYQYSYSATMTDMTKTYSSQAIQDGYYLTWSQSVSSGSWTKIDIVSTEDVEITVTGSVSGQLYDATSKSFSKTVNFGSTETISFKILNPTIFGTGASAFVSGTFTFQHTGIQSETRYKTESMYLLSGGVLLCGGVGLAIYGARSNKISQPMTPSSLTTVQNKKICPKCGSDNPLNSAFCQQCGQRLS